MRLLAPSSNTADSWLHGFASERLRLLERIRARVLGIRVRARARSGEATLCNADAPDPAVLSRSGKRKRCKVEDILFVALLLLFLVALDKKNEGKPLFFYICLTLLTLYLGFVVLNTIIE